MLSHRIITASAVLLAVTIGSAAAQDQPSAGKPLQLLKFAHPQARAPLHPHARVAEKLAKPLEVKRHVAKTIVAKHHKMFAATHLHAVHLNKMAEAPPAAEPARPASAAAPATIWPAVNAAAPAAIAMPSQAAAPRNVTTEQVVSDAPNDIAANGQIAQAAAVAEPNVPDPATEHHDAALDIAPPAQSAAAEPVVRAMVATPDPVESDAISQVWTGQVGSASWMAQVVAALGGAMVAGVVAWFLILRRRPEREDAEFLLRN
jgi:sensor c-di-GMP phosphodiesterase-like protein